MRIKERCVFLVYFKLNITGLQHCVSPPPEGSIITESTDLPWMLSYVTSIKVLSSVSAVSGVYCLCLNPIRGKPEKQKVNREFVLLSIFACFTYFISSTVFPFLLNLQVN